MIYVQFKRLDSLSGFKKFLYEHFQIKMEMADIEARRNYNFISNLTGIISWVLVFFSLLSVCLFIYNLLHMHLQKIKMNIGTFSAFGIDQKVLDRIYLFIMVSFVLSSLFVGFAAATLIGYSGTIQKMLILMKSNIEPGRIYFELGHWWTLYTIIIFLLISFITLKFISHKVFYQTPGNLIYNRDE